MNGHRLQPRDGYEALLLDDHLRDNAGGRAHPKRKRRQDWKVYMVFVSSFSVMMLIFCWCAVAPAENPSGVVVGDNKPHTTPTLLSLIHPETGEHLSALENPLYEQLKRAEFFVDTKAQSLLRHTRENSQLQIVQLPTLSLDKTLIQIRDPLTLSWTKGQDSTGNPLVSEDDIVCLYCPALQEHHDPLQFREAATIAQIRATSQKHGGNNTETWFIPSFSIWRQESCQFHLYKKISVENDKNFQLHLMAKSPVLSTPDSLRTPTALHLAWTNVTSEMLIHFVTGESGTPVAMYGTSKTPTAKVQGTSDTYLAKDMCQEPANVTQAGQFQPPGMLHVVKLTDLKPNTTYHYKVGLASGQGITWSDTYDFITAPPAGDTEPFSYVVYGDQGCPSVGWGDGGLWTAALAAREISNDRTHKHDDTTSPSLPITQVHHVGDLSYARGAAHIWDEWFHMIQVFAARVPLMIGVGNHEYDHRAGGQDKDPSGVNASHGFMPVWGNYGDDSGGECGVAVSRRFQMPPTGNGVFWYSHEYASLHTIMLSSEHDLSENSPQYQWLVADLESVNRTLTPWVVVEMHRPLYHSETYWDENIVGMGLRYEVEQVLYKYKVDIVLSGHYHSYLRTCDGLYQSKCGSGGPMHITIGTAGAFLDSGTLYEQDWTEAFRREDFGYGRISVWNSTAIHFEFVKAGAEDDEGAGTVLDDVWVLRNRQ